MQTLIGALKLLGLSIPFAALWCVFLLSIFTVHTEAQTSIIGNSSVTGDASVVGSISKGSGTFVIDHPLDPENKLLYHSFVESPDAKNIYDGIATLDENGEATVTLPGYFMALNGAFRYQATPLSGSMPELHLKHGVEKRYFDLFGDTVVRFSGGTPNGEISWQVTGIRHDPYIEANPIEVEVEKGPDALAEQGEYLFPELYAATNTATSAAEVENNENE